MMDAAPKTLFDRLWEEHVIATSPEGLDLVHIDRSLLTDLSGTIGLEDLEATGRRVRNPDLHAAIPDHAIATGPMITEDQSRLNGRFVEGLARLCASHGVPHFPRGSGAQGIVHVFGLEQGFVLPGLTVVCGDSHTSTHGAVGALAWGIGSTEVAHVLATQTLWMKRPKRARICVQGQLAPDVQAKDLALWLIGKLGADYGREHAVEFAGPAIEALSIEARATLCNLAIEMGARFGLVAPDQTTFDYVQGRPFAPDKTLWPDALAHWKTLQTDEGAVFDKDISLDAADVTPQLSWGTSPEQVVGGDGTVPESAPDEDALAYMGVRRGQPLSELAVDYVFIGSCANSRIEDLRSAAQIIRGRKIAPHVIAWVVPGSEKVKRQAEEEGLDRDFLDAGFKWREPGCSMCVAANGDIVAPGKRAVSTSNRNFVGRQGPGARTHLASPATAAACALAGHLTTTRMLGQSA